MKKSICLYFQVHQPTRLRLYRFFDIGKDSHYYDDFANRTILKRIAQKCYLPMNELLLEAITKSKGKIKLAFSITGSALEQFDRYAPEVIESFRALADTGCVEFLCETYNHSLASLISGPEFEHQVKKHKAAIEQYFGVTPTTFRNTELIYSDGIGKAVYELGFKTMLTEGARHIMGWKNPNYIYSNDFEPGQKLLLRNYSMSDDIAFRFSDRGWSEWPLTAEKYVEWLHSAEGEIVNLFMDYETFGEHQSSETGIFEFMRALTGLIAKDKELEFVTPSRAAAKHKAVGELSVPQPISWADEERGARHFRLAGQRAPAGRLQQAVWPGGEALHPGRSRPVGRLRPSPGERPPLLHVYEVLLRRGSAQALQPVRHSVRGFHQLYECTQRFHYPRQQRHR